MIKLNEKKINYTNDIFLDKLLISEGYSLIRIAVELNGDIIPKSQYINKKIEDGDSIQVVGFVGGG